MNSESLSREDEQQAAGDREDELLTTIATLRRELSDALVDRYVTLALVVAKMMQALNETADMLDLLMKSTADSTNLRSNTMGYTNEEKAVFEKAAGTYERLAQQCMESVMNESSEERIQALNALASQYLGIASRMRVWANEDVDAIPVA